MNNTIRKLKLLGQTEVTLAEMTVQRAARCLALAAVAVGLALLAILAVNVGTFFLLAESFSHGASAFLVAGGNVVLAGAFLFLVKRTAPNRAEELARDMRDLARQELNSDIDQMGAAFSSGERLGSSLSLAAPVIEWAIGLLRRRRRK